MRASSGSGYARRDASLRPRIPAAVAAKRAAAASEPHNRRCRGVGVNGVSVVRPDSDFRSARRFVHWHETSAHAHVGRGAGCAIASVHIGKRAFAAGD
ncbi:hypothetical protein DB771_15965 [Burkholderia sp. AU29985]|nr:hypothetical protein XM57_01015 [Burkholderia cepacia]AYZ95898.1 hypothetical protein EGY28_12190 [Burkholderia dolosa]PRE54384.1 hypothetical protein C6P87_05950 [Burkholderia sp. AU12872]PUA75848.1 hypothetical protein DB771_15965 [Burkholderia sp. AU29985]